MIPTQQDSPLVIDNVRKVIENCAEALNKPHDAMWRHAEMMYVKGWMMALVVHDLLSKDMKETLEAELDAMLARAKAEA